MAKYIKSKDSESYQQMIDKLKQRNKKTKRLFIATHLVVYSLFVLAIVATRSWDELPYMMMLFMWVWVFSKVDTQLDKVQTAYDDLLIRLMKITEKTQKK